MAQITEKRTHLSHGSHVRTHTANNVSNNNTMVRSKENSSTRSQQQHHSPHGARKGVEILDFHESWLEEVQLYKDKMIVCNQYPHHHHHHNHNNMLSTHNHLHTPLGGCQTENSSRSSRHVGGGHGNGISGGENISNKKDVSTKTNTLATSKRRQDNNKTLATTKTTTTNSSTKARGVVQKSNGATGTTTEPYKKVQMLLKRAREEAFVKEAINSKRTASVNQSSAKTGHGAGSHSPGSGVLTNGSVNGTKSSKIVVNTFHASSLLSAQHHENDKTNFLTQNGLTKSAVSALETSLYASLYASHSSAGAVGLPHYNSVRLNSGEHASYVGVSMNRGGGGGGGGGGVAVDGERQGHANHDAAEDDPCAAIDEVNNYDDSDSEEDYIGCPFYLEEDGNETRQSRNIRLQIDEQMSNVSISTNDSEKSVYYKPTSILTPSLFPNVPPYLNFTSHADKGPPMPPALHRVLKWKLSPVMPKIVKRVVLNSGFRIIKNTTDWMAVWEKHMKSPGFRTIRSHQKYNHIPGSFRIGRKDTMWRSIYNNMKKYGKKEFGFMQKSYIMPDDLESLRQVWPKNASKLAKWIVKPPASARGTGIRIVNKWSQFPKDRPLVVQKYIERPLLINDNKFDMRLYVVLTSINPLRIYMYKDGLARFASVKYSSELSNLDERCMHLTNYSINKFSQNYTKNEDFNACQGHKWTLQSLWSCLEGRGVNTKRLWATLRNLVIKAIVSGESGLNRMYRQNVNFRYNCFELFGFDVLLDENLVPWLLEINISPSLHSELPLDLHVKGPLIQAVLNTALYQVPPKLSEKQQQEIVEEMGLKGPLCHDKRIFTTCLTAEEVRKHNQYTNRSIEFREEYIDTILDNMLPDDVRCILVGEDELARCKPLERVFPTADTHVYLRFVENPRYYNRLMDAWEHKYSLDRSKGIALLRKFCQDDYHLQVSDAAMEKEPNVALTEIDMLHVKKDDTLDSIASISTVVNNIMAGKDVSSTTITPQTAVEHKTKPT